MVVAISVSNLIVASVLLGLVISLVRYLLSKDKNYNFKGELVYAIFSSPALILGIVVVMSIVTDSAHTNTIILKENMLFIEYCILVLMIFYSGYILISYPNFKYAKSYKEAFDILLQKFLNLLYLLIIGVVIKLIVASVKDVVGGNNNDR